MFYTIAYRRGWIHASIANRSAPEVFRVQYHDGTTRPARSLHAAKCILSRRYADEERAPC